MSRLIDEDTPIHEVMKNPRVAAVVQETARVSYEEAMKRIREQAIPDLQELRKGAATVGFNLACKKVVQYIREYQQASYAAMEAPDVDEEIESHVCQVLDAVIDTVMEIDAKHIKFPGDPGHPETEEASDD